MLTFLPSGRQTSVATGGMVCASRKKCRRCFCTAEIQSAKHFLKSIKDIRMVEITIMRPCGSSRLKCLGYDEIGRWISSPAGSIEAHERVHWSRTGVRSITRRILSRGLPVSTVPELLKGVPSRDDRALRAPHRANHASSTVIYLRSLRPCSFIAFFSAFSTLVHQARER